MRRRVCVSLRSLARILNLQMHYITDVMVWGRETETLTIK